MIMVVLFIFLICVSAPCFQLVQSFTSFNKIPLPPRVTGAESVAVDPQGGGPYISVTDGRILKWQGPDFGFMDFATTAPNRSKALCDGTTDPNLIFTCGRPLAFSFNQRTGDLYIVDAVLGLFVVGRTGGPARLLANTAEGVAFKFLNGVDVDPITGNVYLSSSTTTFDIRNITQPGFVPDSTGRLLRYNPRTEQVTVLLRGLSVAIGPAVSADGSFVIFSEFSKKRVLRYWLRGSQANRVEVFSDVEGNPNKIKRTTLGNFWVTVNNYNEQTQLITPLGFRFNIFATILQEMNFSKQYFAQNITVLHEQNGVLRVGCRTTNFVGEYR